MEQKPTHKEDPLITLKETLVNAISTIDRMKNEENVVFDRNNKAVSFENMIETKLSESKTINQDIKEGDRIKVVIKNSNVTGEFGTVISSFKGVGMCTIMLDKYPTQIIVESACLEVISEIKEESVLDKGKEVLNSQSECQGFTNKFKVGDKVRHKIYGKGTIDIIGNGLYM